MMSKTTTAATDQISLIDREQNWVPGAMIGWWVEFWDGEAKGEKRQVSANTRSMLTFSLELPKTIEAGVRYSMAIIKPAA
jgi:hypothetical protein